MPTIDHHQRTISVARLAVVLDVPAPTIRGWLARGVLPSVRIGGRRLVLVEAVEGLLQERLAVGQRGEP
jgi:excisionase family DNA binding protein